MKYLFGLLAAHILCSSLIAADFASLVNPFVGTGISRQNDYGKVHPGASMPFGMLYWSPDQAQGEFYDYAKPVIRGFSLTHISGPGCPAFGDVPIMPLLGTPRKPIARFDHVNEAAEPGYYSVLLASGIRVQLAAAVRAGIARITFPDNPAQRTLVIDLGHNLTRVDDASITIQGNRIAGSVASGHFCGAKNRYRIYFVIETDQTPASYGKFDGGEAAPQPNAGRLPSGAYLSFPTSIRTLRLRAAVSYVSIRNAQTNLHEIDTWDFDDVRAAAKASWNDVLGKVQVKGGSNTQRRVFYTALYHSFLHPSTFSDATGEYMGFDGLVHHAEHRVQYTNISGWDVYRSQVQLIVMLFPDRGSDIAASLVADAQQDGGLPRWPIANDDCGCMVGDPSDLIIASLYAFGARSFDTRAALNAMVKDANDPAMKVHAYPARPYLKEYLRNGYVAATGERYGPASISLEYQNADFAISRFADALGDAAVAHQFLLRSANWRKLFDPATRYIRPRDDRGSFVSDFDPGAERGFVEGNAAQYTWMIPYDLKGVIDSLGGISATNARLDNYFSEYSRNNAPYFNIANEPSFSNPWIYNWTGEAWRTQEVVRKTLQTLFQDLPGGLPGNDDLGATSSWVVFACLGFYPPIPAVGGVTLNTPVFPEATIRFARSTLKISAARAPEREFIKTVCIDGRLIRDDWIPWHQLSTASRLSFSLAALPQKNVPLLAPPSFAPQASPQSKN
jgi:predicted alpha-1,2-mannosidase